MFPSSSAVRATTCRKFEQTVGFACSAAKRRKFSNGVIPFTLNTATTRKSNPYIVEDTRRHLLSRRRTARGGSFRQQSRLLHQATRMEHRAFIALGSNLGDRVAMIESACKEMDRTGKLKVLRTSSLWETKAMYVLDQDNFVNGVCEVRLA
jgi:2-amino-4-hydroxy-6-hydroxymethyldihydropteridine diphosphokinase/dihydropteroate synthase